MATEVLAAVHDPVTLNGSTTYAAATLTHSSRVLSFDVTGELNTNYGKFEDEVKIEYTTDGGSYWAPVNTYVGAQTINDSYSFAVSATATIPNIQTRITSVMQVPISTAAISNNKLTCDSAAPAATIEFCDVDLVGF